MASMVTRDSVAMKRFADEIDQYSESMRHYNSDLLRAMDDARPFMKDAASQKAFQKIEEFARNLLGSLPAAQEAAVKLRQSAKFLETAGSIQI